MYKYIFYKLYKIAKKTEKNWTPEMRMPASLAITTISILQFLNLMTLKIFLVHGLKTLKQTFLSKEIVIIIGLFLYIINYFLFMRNKKYLLLEEKFDKESRKLKLIKTILFWIYVLLSFLLLFYMFENFKTVKR